MRDRLQASRRELKFRIDEQTAVAIEHYLRPYLRPDAHSQSYGRGGYPVSSVYLDSASARLYGQTVKGDRNRHKLRIRVYDDNVAHPAFVEIKRRDGQVILKQRAGVDRQMAMAILEGAPSSLVEANCRGDWNAREHQAIREFCRLRDRIRAIGTTYVCYRREAYVSPDGLNCRATFDRRLSAKPYRAGNPVTVPDDCVPTSDYDAVVFELKFTNRFPNWMAELVRSFNLCAISFPKYINCADSIGTIARHSRQAKFRHTLQRAGSR